MDVPVYTDYPRRGMKKKSACLLGRCLGYGQEEESWGERRDVRGTLCWVATARTAACEDDGSYRTGRKTGSCESSLESFRGAMRLGRLRPMW